MSEKKMTSIGGQAVIEGVMMRGPEKTAVAVRKPDGNIIIEEKTNKVKGGFRKIPIIRGVFSFASSMVIGINALMFSANFYEEDGTAKKESTSNIEKENNIENKNNLNQKENNSENIINQEENNIENTKIETVNGDVATNNKENKNELSGVALFLTIASSLAISIGLFIVLPNLVAGFVVEKEKGNLIYNLIEGIVKMAIFLGYMALVSQMKDIKRVFEYHGAEHKTIFCYENGEELTVDNVKKYQRFHPRCGTSFLLFVMIVSIIIYSCVERFENPLINVLFRLLLLPVIAGISYEIIRFAGRHTDNKWIAWLSKPGMWLQRLTTREPDASQIEVAIASLKAVIPKDKKADLW